MRPKKSAEYSTSTNTFCYQEVEIIIGKNIVSAENDHNLTKEEEYWEPPPLTSNCFRNSAILF